MSRSPLLNLAPTACVGCGRELAVEAHRFCTWCLHPRPVFYGAHGGAGSSMLAGLLGGIDGGRFDTVDLAALPTKRLCVLIARTHLAGLQAMQRALGAHPDLYDLVVFNRDAPGRLTKPITDRAYIITGTAIATLTCPFVPAWRTDPTDTTDRAAATFLTSFRNRYYAPQESN
ncbi:DUF6668 family protein [Leifsonia sp. McL0607]|uniref:DUF6668 family protein n=1 Tax=Leifsonia sp. McL0607 TaxID=3415672 RepID=UPI003CE8AC21